MGEGHEKGDADASSGGRRGRATEVIVGAETEGSRVSPRPRSPTQDSSLIAERFGLEERFAPALVELPGESSPVDPQGESDGKYIFGRQLGRGGMGVVVAAKDVELGRTVAVKTLHEAFQDLDDQVSALVFEARISGQLEHPHIVPVHEMGRLKDGRVYYTMKLTGKTTLNDHLSSIRDGKSEYTVVGLLQLLRGVCMAMEYAHSRGVIHRDLKPENVLIGDYGEVQIMDWGVARVLPTTPGGDALFAGRVEPQGVIVGTPHYMSPEQARGDNDNVGPPSDIYSIGLILYQMLTLRLPFDTLSAETQMAALIHEDVPPPSIRAPDRDVAPELERICMLALEREPSERYQSARALWEDIEAFIEGKKDEERLRRLADAQIGKADEAAARYYLLRQKMKRMVEDVRGASLSSSHFDTRSERREKWQNRLEVDYHRLVEARAFAEAVAGYHQALAYETENEHARQSLAALYRSQSHDAWDRGDDATMILYGDLERTVLPRADDAASVILSVRSYPESAHIRLYELQGREMLSTDDAEDLGVAPLYGHEIQAGSYLLSAKLPGCRENRVPIVVYAGQKKDVLVTLRPWSADTPLFGHQDQYTAICDAFESCLAQGKLAGMLLLGEAGAGKNQLLVRFDDYIDRLPEGVSFVHASCPKIMRRVPFGAAAQIMRHRAGIGPWDSHEEIREKVDHLVLEVFSRRGRTTFTALERKRALETGRLIASMPGLCGSALRLEGEHGVEFTRRVFAAFASFFEQLALQGALLLKIRGADNIDRLTRDCLVYLSEQLRNMTVFFLGTARDDSVNLRVQRPLALSPLNIESVGHQVCVLLGGAIAAPVKTLIHGLSKGNPTMVADLTRHFRRKGWLRQQGSRWELCEDESVLSWLLHEGPSLTNVMMTMLEGLSDGAIEVLGAASVVGSRFYGEELQARLDGDLGPLLEELVQAEVLAKLPVSRIKDTQEYAFRLELLRRALYEDLDPSLRSAAHEAVANWLAANGNQGLETIALRAKHLRRAGREELAKPLEGMLTAEAALWERSDAPHWFSWPDDHRSGVF